MWKSALAVTVIALFMAANVIAASVPDYVEITTPEGQKPRTTWIKSVEFDHALHGDMYDCAICHHMEEGVPPEEIMPCTECHYDTQSSAPDSFYKAWHGPGQASCVGCHKMEGVVTGCTEGCHPKD
jgi:hypothetical protein